MINAAIQELLKLDPPFEFLLQALYVRANQDQKLKIRVAFPVEYNKFLKELE